MRRGGEEEERKHCWPSVACKQLDPRLTYSLRQKIDPATKGNEHAEGGGIQWVPQVREGADTVDQMHRALWCSTQRYQTVDCVLSTKQIRWELYTGHN